MNFQPTTHLIKHRIGLQAGDAIIFGELEDINLKLLHKTRQPDSQ